MYWFENEKGRTTALDLKQLAELERNHDSNSGTTWRYGYRNRALTPQEHQELHEWAEWWAENFSDDTD